MQEKFPLIEEKAKLIKNKENKEAKTGIKSPIKEIYRGGVFNAELGTGNIGGEKNKTRPVLVMTPNHMNKGHTVVVVPLSTKYKLKANGLPQYDSNYLLKKSDYPQLAADSMIKFEDMRSIDVVRLREFLFNVDKNEMKKLKRALLAAMGY